MQHPIQLVATVQPKENRDAHRFLLAACGPRLVSVSLGEGRIVSQWPAEDVLAQATSAHDVNDGDGERPAKKQKTSANGNAKPAALPDIIKLVTSPSHDYAVAVTDDKSVHVFTVAPDGGLHVVNQRMMPKRPCAVEILPDNDTITVGDKFGDVYSIPLVPAATGENENIKPDQATENAQAAPPSDKKPAFKPAATNLTVHTKRNRKALEAQQQQKNFTPKKEALEFEHKLLLGHVSMLTDALFAIKEVEGVRRGHIITADRDEHIRISRGPPQAHIIEGFCLGHTEYISKLCLIPGTDLLVSGGGDNWLGVWDWPTYTLRRKFNLLDDVSDLLVKSGKEMKEEDKRVNVSGLWAVTYTVQRSPTLSKKEPALAVALEKQPFLLIIPVSRLQTKTQEQHTVHHLPAPPLDLAVVDDTIIVTLDGRHDGDKRIQALKLNLPEGHGHDKGLLDVAFDKVVEGKVECLTEEVGVGQDADEKALDRLLYNVADLRKRRGWAEGRDEKDGEADGGALDESEVVDDQ